MTWWYLSFADGEWRGAAIVRGTSMMDAIQEAWRLKVNPGGNVIGDVVPGDVPMEFCERLLNEDDLKALDLAVGGEGATTRVRA